MTFRSLFKRFYKKGLVIFFGFWLLPVPTLFTFYLGFWIARWTYNLRIVVREKKQEVVKQ